MRSLTLAPLVASILICLMGCGAESDSREPNVPSHTELDIQTNVSGGDDIYLANACAFSHTFNGTVPVREASAEAEVAIQRIVDYTGLPKNFVVLEADIDNAVATVIGSDRVIVYDPTLLSRSDWTALGLVAHEVGHHLSGHTLQTTGRLEDELEADSFAGYVLGRMGATASEALEVMALIPGSTRGTTHPSKGDRVRAVEAGWGRASNQKDRPSELVTPPAIPDYGMSEIVFVDNESLEIMTGDCAFETYRGAIMQATEREGDENTTAFEITLDLDGPGRRTIYAHEWDLSLDTISRVERSWFYVIAKEGRRVEVELAFCGSGGIENLIRIKAL